MPDMGPRLKKSWLRFQDRARTNFAGLIVDSLVNRIQPNGIVIGGDPNSALSSQAGRIWRDNRMDVAVADAVRDACTLGTGYLLVTRDENGKAVITRERPEQFFALPDPVHPWRALAAVKVWRDSTAETDYLRLWADGSLMEYSRPSFTQFGSAREYVETFTGKWVFQAVSPCDGVPVVLLDNKDRAGEFEYHLPLLDRIHWGFCSVWCSHLCRLSGSARCALPTRMLPGWLKLMRTVTILTMPGFSSPDQVPYGNFLPVSRFGNLKPAIFALS